ncbi:MAG: hypothetical protein ACKO3G_07240 [Planctomycetaceae bacterium]
MSCFAWLPGTAAAPLPSFALLLPSLAFLGVPAGPASWATVGLAALALVFWLCFRWIPNDRVGVVEKWWSLSGSVPEGRIIATGPEAGYRADILRGGLHFGWWRWQYAIHTVALVTIP